MSAFQEEASPDADNLRQKGLKPIRILVGTYPQMGTSLNFIEADGVILATANWTGSNMNQAIGRNHRLGKKKPTFSVRLVTKSSRIDGANFTRHQKRELIIDVSGHALRPDEVVNPSQVQEEEERDAEDYEVRLHVLKPSVPSLIGTGWHMTDSGLCMAVESLAEPDWLK